MARLMRLFIGCVVWCAVGAAVRPAAAAEDGASIVVLPQTFSLATAAATQQLVVQERTAGQFGRQITQGVVLESSDPAVVKVVDGVAFPVGNGRAKIVARAEGRSAECEVVVTGRDRPQRWNFYHIESVFSKAGCNSGACHGALAGQNGFKLTLFGYDPEADFLAVTRHAQGRRITLGDPGQSLLLIKPTGLVPHKGGVKIEVDSPEYRILADWIAAGAPPSGEDEPKLDRLEILPHHSRQRQEGRQQLLVLAHFSDGHMEDVTRWAKFRSTDETVAAVDSQGLARLTGSGEGAVNAWYLNTNALARLSVPYANSVPPEAFSGASRRNFINELVLAKLRELNLPPAPLCDDATFVRRAYLDTVGVLPPADEARAFLADASPDKRDRLIDRLLTSPEYVDYWTYKWSDLLLVNGETLRPDAVKSYHGWIRRHVALNTPWDALVRQIVTAKGNTLHNGAANFYSLHQEPTTMAETVSMAFLGMSIACAKCHNHPLEKWTNDQYYSFAGLFARVRAKGWGGDVRNGDGNRVVFAADEGDILQPGKNSPQPPAPLDAPPLPLGDPRDRREVLADWLTSPKNPYFTRAVANRVWANFFGVGLVEAVDDVRLTNPASNEELMDAAGRRLVAHKYDLRELMRDILGSATYQRSSVAGPANRDDSRFYSRYYPRRLKAEVLLDALSQVTGTPTEFKDFPRGTRALQLPDSSVVSYFLRTFGRPERLITCECERSDEPSMTQVLHLYNGATIAEKLEAKDNRIDQLLAAGLSSAATIEELYLAALARMPTAEEQKRLAAILDSAPENERRAVVEDLAWAIVTSKEFLFNH
jgi:hypothetical protein